MRPIRSLAARVASISALLFVTGCSSTSGTPSITADEGPTLQVGGNGHDAVSVGGSTNAAASSSTGGTSTSTAASTGNFTSSGGTAPGSDSPTSSSGGSSASSDGGTTNSTKTTPAATGGVTNDSGTSGVNEATAASTTGGRSSSVTTTVAASGGSSTSNSTGGATAGNGLTLYYIRHAEVEANVLDAEQITMDSMDTFTELGTRQIDAVTTYLKDMGVTPDAIIVSPTKRTQKTIEPYLVAKNLQGEIWMELTECCSEEPTGAALPTEPKYANYYKAAIEGQNLSFRDTDATKYWQNDTYEEGLFMVMTARDAILSRFGQSGKTIFVVGHAFAGATLIGLLRGDDVTKGAPLSGPNGVYLINTGIMHLTQDPTTGLFNLEGRNINSPLRE